MTHFTGSYGTEDVAFLLNPVDLPDTPVHLKETLIQSGQQHYSQLLTHEALPPDDYVELFRRALDSNQDKLAQHLLVLARAICRTRPQGITLVSLARAGTPIGVLLKHILARYFARDAAHYSISILRDVGIDANALRYIAQNHPAESVVFVDGWTGKGVIARQLCASLQAFAKSDGIVLAPELYVLTDLCGYAAVAASCEDYLIPSCILNATVSGLISRTVYRPDQAQPGDFHSCLYYAQFAGYDLSAYFVNTVLAAVENVWQRGADLPHTPPDPAQLQAVSAHCLAQLSARYHIRHANSIKPGIGEATRVLLRREARALLLQDDNAEATQHLRWLAAAKAIPITVIPDLPYRAVALINERAL